MRTLAIVAVLVPTLAGADTGPEQLRTSLASPDTLLGAMADDVKVGGLAFLGTCAKKFGKPQHVRGAARKDLAACLTATHATVDPDLHDGKVVLRLDLPVGHDAKIELVDIELRNDRIVAIGGHGQATLPTLEDLEPGTIDLSDSTKAAIAMAPGGTAEATIEICVDAKGNVQSQRLVAKGVPALDREVTSHFAALKKRPEPIVVDGKAIAACELVRIRYPLRPPASQAPPGPPPPPAYLNVPPAELEKLRTAGKKDIVPDAGTQKEIERSGKDRVIGSFKMCLDDHGAVTAVSPLKTTGFAAYDTAIQTEMKAWKYKPYVHDGKPTAVCTAVTFIYARH